MTMTHTNGIERSNEKPTQREMTNFALNHLNKQCNGFFLMTEGSQIDWAAHDNDANEMIEEFKDFDLTIRDLINFVNEDNETLLIVTSDHETGGLQILKQDDDKVVVQWGTGRHTSIPVGCMLMVLEQNYFKEWIIQTFIIKSLKQLITKILITKL